jgi:hypothetical protein
LHDPDVNMSPFGATKFVPVMFGRIVGSCDLVDEIVSLEWSGEGELASK